MFIRRLTIERYRGIEQLEWRPRAGLNCLIGPGDAGKSTVLAAIALLLDPRASGQAQEFDYHRRDIASGFRIEAVLGGVEAAVSSERSILLQGWRNGTLQPMPEEGWEPVLVVRVQGTPDLDIEHAITTPAGDDAPFSSALRRRLLLARVSGGDRAMAELRLGRGSLLDRAIGGDAMRIELRNALAKAGSDLTIPAGTEAELKRLADAFARSGLPSELSLGLLTPPGQSALGMISLIAGPREESIPLASAGQGTRQVGLFTIAALLMGEAPVIVVDEPESGLEPYRQRSQVREMRRLAGDKGQIFMTTHSAAILSALEAGEVWRMAPGAPAPLSLDFGGARELRARSREALLSRLPILGEGLTEFGFLPEVLAPYAAEEGLASLDASGISFVPMRGQPDVFGHVEQLLDAGLSLGLFVDNEAAHAGRRARVAAHPRCAFGAWEDVTNVEEAVAMYVPFESLSAIVDLAANVSGRQVRALLAQIGDKAGRQGELTLVELRDEIGETRVRRALADAMGGGAGWFKSAEGGRSLGLQLVTIGMPAEIDRVMRRFWRELRARL